MIRSPSNTPRVLHLIDTAGPGGAETVLLTLLERLDRDKWTNHVVLPTRGWLFESLVERGFTPIIVPSARPFDLGYLSRLVRLVRKYRIDLIQTHLFGTAVYGGLAGRICGVPVVSTIHGIVDIGAQSLRRQLKIRILNRSGCRVVLVSQILNDTIIRETSLRNDITRVVLNGIDAAAYGNGHGRDTALRSEIEAPQDAIVVGAVGNVRAPKDYATLLEAAAVLASRSPRYRVVIVGDFDGEPELYRDLLLKRAALGLEHVVCFAGFRADMPRVYSVFDIYVMSSEREGLPLAMLQAMAAGVPVVSTRCGGPQELITDGENGLLVDTRDPVALADAIHGLVSDPRRAAGYAASAKAMIRERYTIERMVEKYESIYEELLGLNASSYVPSDTVPA